MTQPPFPQSTPTVPAHSDPNGDQDDSQPAADVAMDPALTTIQPGGGIVMSIELAWGKLRRKYLRAFRQGFVARMEQTRQGNRGSLPFEPVDPRDLKYYRNQDTYWWAESDDPFRWRDALPFVRAGLAELILIGGGFIVLAARVGHARLVAAVPARHRLGRLGRVVLS